MTAPRLSFLAAALLSSACFANQASLSSSAFHTAFIDNGSVFAMGSNTFGEIQTGTGGQFMTPLYTGVQSAKSIAVNLYRTAVLKTDGSALVMGMDWTMGASVSNAVPATGITDIALSLMDVYYITGGTLYKWNGSATGTPVAIASGVSAVSAGSTHVLVLFADGSVGAVGDGANGQLGLGSLTSTSSVTKLSLPGTATQVAASDNSSYVKMSTGSVFSFGRNNQFQLGLGYNADVFTPVQVPGVTNVNKVVVGQNAAVLILNDKTAMVTGWHDYVGGTLNVTNNMFTVLPVTNVIEAAIGQNNIAVNLGVAGQRQGWGDNQFGKIGDGTTTERHTVTVSYFTPVAAPVTVTPATIAVKGKSHGDNRDNDPFCKARKVGGWWNKLTNTDAYRCGIKVYPTVAACYKANFGERNLNIQAMCKVLSERE